MITKVARTQQDIVDNVKNASRAEEVDRLRIPGLEELHLQPREEIAATLVNVLKSRKGIKKLVWELGKPYIELTVDVDG